MKVASPLAKAAFVASVLAIVAGASLEPRGLGAPAASSYAIADLGAIRKAHARWGELEKIQRDRQALVKDWQNFVDTYGPREEEVKAQRARLEEALKASLDGIRPSFQSEVEARRALLDEALGNYREELMREVKRAVEAKREELTAALEDDSYAFALSVNQQADEYSRKVSEEYKLPMLNLTLKLSLSGINDEERERMQGELDALRKELADKVRARQDAASQDIAAYVKKRERELEAQLSDFEAELLSGVEDKVNAERNRLEMEFTSWRARRLAELEAEAARRKEELIRSAHAQLGRWESEMVDGFRRKEAAFNRTQEDLKRSEGALLAAIDRDIKAAIGVVSRKLGVTVKLLDGTDKAKGARDVTDMVIGVLQEIGAAPGGSGGTVN